MPAVVIHRYVKVGGDGVGKSKAHIRYIQYRRGEDKERAFDDPSGPKRRELFDGERDSVDRRELDRLIDKEREGQVAIHKLTLSPGVDGVDMKEYTREVMEELGKSKGLELQWAAVVHQNTDHDHAHVVVLGQDKNGRQVQIVRSDHDLLRYKCDKYLEREHDIDRELERELKDIERVERELGLDRESERSRERLGSILGKGQVFGAAREVDESRRQEKDVLAPWSKELAVEQLSEREKIDIRGEVYTKYSSTEELKGLDEHLKTHYEDRVDKRQYAMLQRWVDTKERHGDDCHEKWDRKRYENKDKEPQLEAVREWHELDKSARKAYEDRDGVISRRMPRQQRIYEERGRNESFHVTYQNNMARQRLEEVRERSNDPDVLKYIDKELEFLKESRREAQREVEPIDLDKLFGRNQHPERERGKPREPDRALNVDEIKFSDPQDSDSTAGGDKKEREVEEVEGRDRSSEKAQNRESDGLKAEPEKSAERGADEDGGRGSTVEHEQNQQENQQQQQQAREAQEQSQQLGERQGQEILEQKTFKSREDRDEEERDRGDEGRER